jgi:putative heme-binding domain-containing protein
MTSLNRDTAAIAQVIDILGRDTAANRRAAAEALGRIGDPSAVPHLLAAAAKADDRALEHSIIYAIIELAQPEATRSGLDSKDPKVLCAALVALDQIPGGNLDATSVIKQLDSDNEKLRQTARWLVERHAEWGDDLTEWFRQRLADIPAPSQSDVPQDTAALEELLVRFARNKSIQQMLAETVIADGRRQAQEVALRVMATANLREAPAAWRAALAKVIERADGELLPLAVAAARATQSPKAPDALHAPLVSVANSTANPVELRVLALAAASSHLAELEHNQFEVLLDSLATDQPASLRSVAVAALEQAPLTPAQLDRMCEAIKSAGPLELNRLLAPFARGADEETGIKLVRSLRDARALASLRVDLLREALKGYGPEVERAVDDLERLVNVDAAAQRKRIEELLPLMAGGDVRRGHAVYYNSKAACSACHRLGNAGGEVGPELSHIGEIRTERDLLESILYPNLSIVRSFESVLIIKTDGRTLVGKIRDESPDELVVVTGADQETRLARADIETIEPSTVSVMPAGLDKQLTTEQLADLVAFLKNAKGG